MANPPTPRRLPCTLALMLVVALLAPAMGARAAGPLRFTSDYRWYDAGLVGEDLAVADFDGDGLLDLAVIHPFDDAVSVLRGDPSGGFHSRIGYAAGPAPEALSLFDTDGDGATDLVITNPQAGTLSVLHGRGDGTFEPRRNLATAANAGPVLGEDVDGDGVLDLVFAAETSRGSVILLRGQGNGVFGAAEVLHGGAGPMRLFPVARQGSRGAAIAAIAGDGRVTVRAVNGPRSFRTIDELALDGVPGAALVADLDQDGHADLAVALVAGPEDDANERGRVRLLRGSPSGRFHPALDLDAGFVASSLTATDLDGDGWSDLVAMDRRGGALGVYRNDGAGGLLPAARRVSRTGEGNFAAGDWNCDGRNDVVALGPRGRGIVLLAGNGDGSFGDATDLVIDFGPAALWLGDVDEDGIADLATVDRFTSRLVLLRGDGAGSFAPQDEATAFTTPFAPRRLHGARLAPGRAVDLVVAHGLHDGFLSVGRNDGGGAFTFAAGDTVRTGGLPFAFLLGDVNGDTFIDAIVANDGTNTVEILLGDGSGRFRVHATLEIGGAPPLSLALGRIDGDLHPDLVVASEESHRITVWRGTGSGEFVPGQLILAGLRPLSIALADADADGDLDLYSGQADAFPAGGLVVLYRGDGTGSFEPFAPGRTADVGFDPVRLVVGDLDQVPPLDVAVANGGSSTISILPGLIARPDSFGAPLTVGTGAGAQSLVAGDVDRDGRLDLVFAGQVSDRIGVLLNRTGDPATPAPGATVDIAPGACPNVVTPAAGAVLRVALVGGDDFDPADVLPRSVRLEGVPALKDLPAWSDESGPADRCGDPCGCDGRAPDGVPDALFEFDAAAVLAAAGAGAPGEPQRLRFNARLRGGRMLEVSDCVVVAGTSAEPQLTASGEAPATGLVGAHPLVSGASVGWAYDVPAGGAEVRIGVFDVAGRRVADLVRGFASPGSYTATWDGRDADGRRVAPGVFFLRVHVGAARAAARLVVVP